VTNATARASASNSGVAVSGDIDPDDAASAQTAVQPLRMQGVVTGPPGGSFNFGTSGYPINNSNPRKLGFTHPSTGADRSCGVSGTTNPVVCTTQTGEALPSQMTVRVGNYNTSGTDAVSGLTCSYEQGNGTNTTSAGQGSMPYRTVYNVTSFSSTNGSAAFSSQVERNNNAVGDIPTGEYTEVNVSEVAMNDTITAHFGNPTYLCPANYPGSGQTLTCDKNGNTFTVNNWSTTFVPCPSSSGPPNF